MNKKYRSVIVWILRLAVAAEFAWHGVLALLGEKTWLGWFGSFGIADVELADRLLFIIGLLDLTVALIILIKPLRPVIVWAVIWGIWTASVEAVMGRNIWEFFEHWANWGLPLALLVRMKGGLLTLFKTKTQKVPKG